MARASTNDDDDVTTNQTVLKTIGAQDLIARFSCSKAGFLRKQCGLQRSFKFLKWPTKFVVVSGSCIYLFKDEVANSPSTALSLSKYSRVTRYDGHTRMRWAFTLLPHDTHGDKIMVFSCIGDAERKEWMGAIKKEMCQANGILTPLTGQGLDDYVYLEESVGQIADKEDPYNKIDDADMASRQSLAASKQQQQQQQQQQATLDRPKKPGFKPDDPPKKSAAWKPEAKMRKTGKKAKLATPPPTPPTCNKDLSLSRPSFEYTGNDRKDVESILLSKPEGTFLVRKSRNDAREVLSVNIEGILKEFKIYYKNGQYTIDNKLSFSTTEELLDNYQKNDLPQKYTKLYRAYSITDSGYINT